MHNSIFVIKPYKWEGLWVFDDDRVGLVREPFVAGADRMIDLNVLNEKGNTRGIGLNGPQLKAIREANCIESAAASWGTWTRTPS